MYLGLKFIVALTLTVASFVTSNAIAQTNHSVNNPDWVKPIEPLRLVGNLYYVGTYDLACYLITTPQGHILINTGTMESVPMIEGSVLALGFKMSDIKILLATHAHYDHVGGMAAIKKITGARMLMQQGDASVMGDGGNSDYLFGDKGSSFEAVKVDQVLHEHDTILLGGMKIVALHHPGHTKGATSFLFDVKDEHGSYRVLIANMPTILAPVRLSGMAAYPNVGTDFAKTLAALPAIQFDLWFASHASQFDLHTKYNPGDAYNPEVFRDPKGFERAIDDLKKDYEKRKLE